MLGGAIIYSYYKFVQGLFTFHCVVNIFKILGGGPGPPWPPCRSATGFGMRYHAVNRVGGDEEIFLVYPGSAVGGALSMLH